MIKAIVVDDEAHVRENIKSKISIFFSGEIDVVGEADSVSTAIKVIEDSKPNLLFLDVHIKEGTSFDVLFKLLNKNFDIIFITGFDEHAIKAIKIGALDYILKPIDELELKKAINKAIANSRKENDIEKLVEISREYFQGVKNKRIILKTLENVYVVYENDILYCKSDGNYTTIYTHQKEKIVISKPIKKIIELLSKDIFVRCHQSYIVNKKYVTRYNKQGVLIMNSEDKIPVSSRRKEYVIEEIF